MRALDRQVLDPLGVEITRLNIGLGALTGYAGQPAEAALIEALEAARDRRVGLVDVAPLYGLGRGEQLIGATYAGAGWRPVISTKVGRSLQPPTLRAVLSRAAGEARARGRPAWTGIAAGGVRAVRRRVGRGPVVEALSPSGPGAVAVLAYDPDAVERSVHESRARLALDVLPLVFLHEPQHQPWARLDAVWRRLARLRDAGYILGRGVAGDDAMLLEPIVAHLRPDVVLAAGSYSLLVASAGERLLPTAHRLGIPVLVAGVFNSGLLAAPGPGAPFNYRPAPQHLVRRALAIRRICAKHGVPLITAAMHFPFRNPAVRGIVVGVRDRHELVSDIEAFDTEVPAELWGALDRAGLLPAGDLATGRPA